MLPVHYNMNFQIKRWIEPLAFLSHITKLSIFLSECKGCGNQLVFREEDLICTACRETIVISTDPRCPLCGRIIRAGSDLCGECIVNPPKYRKHATYTRYRGLIKSLILLYKYGGVERLKHLFAEIFVELYDQTFEEAFDCFDYIIPVPQDRGRKRDFLPIYEIAKCLSRRKKIKVLSGNLVKAKKTLPQAGLGRARRIRNLDGAFKLLRPQDIADKKILLIDDVYTTGTTINKCAGVLTKYAADICAMTLAHS